MLNSAEFIDLTVGCSNLGGSKVGAERLLFPAHKSRSFETRPSFVLYLAG